MSIQAVSWVLSTPGTNLPGNARLVMIALANHADHTDGHCWPTMELIAAEAGVSLRTVTRVIPQLVDNGFLEVRKRRGAHGEQRSSDYWLIMDRPAAKWRKPEEPEPQDANLALCKNDSPDDANMHDLAPGQSATAGTLREPSGLEPSDPSLVSGPGDLAV